MLPVEGARRNLAAVVNLLHGEIVQNGRRAADMVGMGVGDDEISITLTPCFFM
jgi:hypothetical protein